MTSGTAQSHIHERPETKIGGSGLSEPTSAWIWKCFDSVTRRTQRNGRVPA
jgi:hypothetical protein